MEMRVGLGAGEVEDGFDKVLGLRARDEDVGRNTEAQAEELLHAGEMLERLLSGAAGHE